MSKKVYLKALYQEAIDAVTMSRCLDEDVLESNVLDCTEGQKVAEAYYDVFAEVMRFIPESAIYGIKED